MQATLQKAEPGMAAGTFASLLAIFGKSADDPLGIRLIGSRAGVRAFARG